MPRKASARPTDVELEILNALWELGPSSVGEVHERLKAQRSTGYSTTLKMMQVMHQKGLLTRDESSRPQKYRTAASRQKTQSQLVDHLIRNAFGGAAGKLLVRALARKRIRPDELAEIKQLIERLEGGEK